MIPFWDERTKNTVLKIRTVYTRPANVILFCFQYLALLSVKSIYTAKNQFSFRRKKKKKNEQNTFYTIKLGYVLVFRIEINLWM